MVCLRQNLANRKGRDDFVPTVIGTSGGAEKREREGAVLSLSVSYNIGVCVPSSVSSWAWGAKGGS